MGEVATINSRLSIVNSPIFIVGANRSGTTLLRLILNAHSRIAIPEELNYFYSEMAGWPIEEWASHTISAGFIDYLIDKTCGPLVELGLDVEHLRMKLRADAPMSLRTPYMAILEAWASFQGKPRWGEKTPANLFYADVLIEMFPHACFIHLVRDPRDGVASMQQVNFFTDDAVFNALARRQAMTRGLYILDKSVPAAQRLTIKYEDLVVHPESTVRQVCAFIGEEYELEMLKFHESAKQHMKKRAATQFNAKATRPITSDAVESWRERLTYEQVAIVEAICSKQMDQFGYRKSSAQTQVVQDLEIAFKRLYWTVKCWQNRDNRNYIVRAPMFARSLERLRTAVGIT